MERRHVNDPAKGCKPEFCTRTYPLESFDRFSRPRLASSRLRENSDIDFPFDSSRSSSAFSGID